MQGGQNRQDGQGGHGGQGEKVEQDGQGKKGGKGEQGGQGWQEHLKFHPSQEIYYIFFPVTRICLIFSFTIFF